MAIIGTATHPIETPSKSVGLWSIWLLLAISSIVLFEPTPYDLLAPLLMVIFFSNGLSIPGQLRLPIILILLFLFCNVIAAIVNGINTNSTLAYKYVAIRTYIFGTWLFFTCLIYERPGQVLDVIWSGYIAAAIIAVAFAVLTYYRVFPNSQDYLFAGRAQGPFKDPNVFGPFLVPIMLYAMAKLETVSLAKGLAYVALMLMLSFGLLIAFSRGAWLDLGFSLSLFISLRFFTIRSRPQYIKLLVSVAAIFTLGFLVMAWAVSSSEISDLFAARTRLVQSYDVDDRGRFSTQLVALESALQHPLGIGPGQAKTVFGKNTHNLYLNNLVETGWVGFIAFVGFLGMTMWRAAWFCFQRTPIQGMYIAIFSATAGQLIQSPFIDSTHWRHLYLLLAMLWGLMLAWQPEKRHL